MPTTSALSTINSHRLTVVPLLADRKILNTIKVKIHILNDDATIVTDYGWFIGGHDIQIQMNTINNRIRYFN